jgi:hypothetical protein
MDAHRFDQVVRTLGQGISRRGVLGALAGAAGAGAREAAANRRKRRGRAKKGKKVGVCHATGGTYHLLTVGKNVVANHLANHGDFLYGDCCTDAECAANETCEVSGGGRPKGWCRPAFAPPDAPPGGGGQPPDGSIEPVPPPASAGTCTPGEDWCDLGPWGSASCNGNINCVCAPSTSGETLCGYFPFSTCYPCDSDDDCVAVTGRGSFCAVASGLFCPCQESNNRACAPPCPDEAPA